MTAAEEGGKIPDCIWHFSGGISRFVYNQVRFNFEPNAILVVENN